MTATTTEEGQATGVTTGVSCVAKEANECQSHNKQRGDTCQDINVKERHWKDDDTSIGDGDGNGAGGGEDKTDEPLLNHGDNIHQHIHHSHNHHHHHLHIQDDLMQSHGDEAAYRLVPPDGGWSWMVNLGTFIITMVLPISVTCFSVLFSEYLLDAGSSSTTTAWIFNLQSFLWHTSALMERSLVLEFGWRLVALTGSTMAAVGLMISAFTPSPYFLFFSYSLLTGIGGGVVTCQCFTILPHYFQRRIGLANGIMMTGLSMGDFIGPPITRLLQASYAFRGATLIQGSVTLNACVGASFFHPFQWHQKKVPLKKEPQEDTPAFPTELKVVSPPDSNRGLVSSPSEASFPDTAAQVEIKGGMVFKKRLSKRLEDRRMSCSSSRQSLRYNSISSLYSSGVGSFAVLPVQDEQKEEDFRGKKQDILLVRIVRSLARTLGVVKYLRVRILCFGHMLFIIGYINFRMMVPFAMLEAGFSLDAAAWCLSVFAGCNMVTRFIVSTLSDWPRFNKRLVYLCGFVIIASSIFAFTLVSSMNWLMVAMVVSGIGSGANVSLFNLVIIDVMGVEHLGSVFGCACFSVAIGALCIGPFIGFIREVTQSYAASMYITSGMMLVALTCWLFMGLAERVDRRREDGKTLTDAHQGT